MCGWTEGTCKEPTGEQVSLGLEVVPSWQNYMTVYQHELLRRESHGDMSGCLGVLMLEENEYRTNKQKKRFKKIRKVNF